MVLEQPVKPEGLCGTVHHWTASSLEIIRLEGVTIGSPGKRL